MFIRGAITMLRAASTKVFPGAIASPRILLSPHLTNAVVFGAKPSHLLSGRRFSAKAGAAQNQLVKALGNEIKMGQLIPSRPSPPAANAIVSRRHFCTDFAKLANYKLVEAIKSEIKSHQLALIRSMGAPENLPFTIEDDARYCHVTLRRNLGEEKMEVTVNPVYEEDGSDEERTRSVYINVSLSQEAKGFLSQEAKGTLDIGAYVSSDKIAMHRIAFSEPNTHHPHAIYYVEADGDLQDALRGLVESRGIEKSTVGFLYDYMVEKRKSWGTVWDPPKKKTEVDDLLILKKFVEEW